MAQWQLSGTYFEACSCDAACPCLFLGSPTQGDCRALIAWHIDRGSYGGIQLDGLNAALAVYTLGTLAKTRWTAAAYFDEQAGADQGAALQAIFSGRAGGHPAVLAAYIGRMRGVKNVPMHFQGEGKRSGFTIPGIAKAEIEQLEGQDGEPTKIAEHPAIAPGVPVKMARSNHFRLNDYGWQWELSGHAAFVSPFTYAAG